MNNYKRIIDLSSELSSSVEKRNALLMQQRFDELESVYKEEFGDCFPNYESFYAYGLMMLASAKYFAFNCMYEYLHKNYADLKGRVEAMAQCSDYAEEQKNELLGLLKEYEQIDRVFSSMF